MINFSENKQKMNGHFRVARSIPLAPVPQKNCKRQSNNLMKWS